MSIRPNPQLNLEHLRKQAKALLRAAQEGDASAKERMHAANPKLSE